MKKTISDQLVNAIEILKSLGGTTRVVTLLEELLQISKHSSIPLIDNVAHKTIVEFLDKHGSVEEWKRALEILPGATLLDDSTTLVVQNNGVNEVVAISLLLVVLPSSLKAMESSNEDLGELAATFWSNGQADLNDEEIGTWSEIYLKLITHVKKNLTVPDFPKGK